MVYLAQIIACEHDDNAARYEAQGWVKIEAETYRALWRQRDLSAIARLRPAPIEPPAVEDDAPYVLHFGGR